MRTKLTCFLFTTIVTLAVFCGGFSSEATTVVACVGDSITAGYGLANASTQSYPAQLQTLLGGGYTVNNYGVSSTTVLKAGYAYWNQSAFATSTNSGANIVVIMFGANDSKSYYWNAVNFTNDYLSMIRVYQNMSSHPKVYICYTTPVYYTNSWPSDFIPLFIEDTTEPAIGSVAAMAPVSIIDNHTPLINQPNMFQDGIHPTPAGAAIVAQQVYNAIMGVAPTNITTATLTSSLNPSVYGGTPVTYTATISSTAGTPTGSVVFTAGNTPFSTNALSGGTASVSYAYVPVSTDTSNNVVHAQYLGQGNYIGSTYGIYQTVLATNTSGPTFTDLGVTAPTPGANDISQLSTTGNTTWPDGINYYDNNVPPCGQSFRTAANQTNLLSVSFWTGGLNSGNGYGTPSSTPYYYLRIYKLSGIGLTNATLIQTVTNGNPGYTDGEWLKWSGLTNILTGNTNYAFTVSHMPTAGGWCDLGVGSGNPYTNGNICTIPYTGGQVTYGSSGNYDAVFVLGFKSSPTDTAPTLATITNRTVNAGQTVAFTASATDTDSPPQTLTFALLTGATNATLDTTSGAFSFRPLVTQADSTNNFTLKASDSGTPVLSATQSFAVVVNPLSAPVVSNGSTAGGQFSISIGGQSGPDYAVETSTNLSQWNNVFITNSPALPFVWTDTNSAAAPQRFYRVKLGPPLP